MPTSEQTPYIPYKHLALIVALVFILTAHWLYTSSLPQASKTTIHLDLPLNTVSANPIAINMEAIQQEKAPASVELLAKMAKKNEDKAIIRQGDTLSALFDRYRLGQTTLSTILSADESLLALETLRPGQILYFRYKENTQYLEEMELYKHPGYQIIYRRIADDAFTYEVVVKEGAWQSEKVSGLVDGIFYVSVQRAGLTETEAATVTKIFQDQLDFSRAIRKGDKFQIVRSVQYSTLMISQQGKPVLIVREYSDVSMNIRHFYLTMVVITINKGKV